jgi:hypothetical protein
MVIFSKVKKLSPHFREGNDEKKCHHLQTWPYFAEQKLTSQIHFHSVFSKNENMKTTNINFA